MGLNEHFLYARCSNRYLNMLSFTFIFYKKDIFIPYFRDEETDHRKEDPVQDHKRQVKFNGKPGFIPFLPDLKAQVLSTPLRPSEHEHSPKLAELDLVKESAVKTRKRKNRREKGKQERGPFSQNVPTPGNLETDSVAQTEYNVLHRQTQATKYISAEQSIASNSKNNCSTNFALPLSLF